MIAGVMTYRIASLQFGEVGLSHYALIRRIISFVQPLLALGIAVSLSRKVAACRYDLRGIGEASYLAAGSVLVVAATLLYSFAVLLFSNWFAYLYFGTVKLSSHTLAMLPMLLGICLHFVCYAQLHGRFAMRWANLAQMVNVGLLPLLVVWCSKSVPAAFLWTGLAITFVSVVGIAVQFCTLDDRPRRFIPALWDLLKFGPPRVPGDLALAGLMMLPATIVTHSSGVRIGGLVAFCTTLLTLSQAAAVPISTILLPQATQMLRSGRIRELRVSVSYAIGVGVGVTAIGVGAFWIVADQALSILLGNYAAELPALAKIISIGALPLSCHTCLRSIVDAGTEQAVNARSACLALCSFFLTLSVTWYLFAPLYAAPLALVLALFCLAGFSSREVWMILKPDSIWSQITSRDIIRPAA